MIDAVVTYFKSVPVWFWLLFTYLFIGGVAALKSRFVWLPIAFAIPLLLLGLQLPLISTLPHEYQLIVILFFLAGLAIGGALLRPQVVRTFPQFRFEVAGEWHTLALILTIFTLKTVFGVAGIACPAQLQLWQCLSALIGVLVPGIFLGRTLFLASKARRIS